ncbi:MAG: hypothetical protein DRP82_05520, partial [Planctomycetota bacterium]
PTTAYFAATTTSARLPADAATAPLPPYRRAELAPACKSLRLLAVAQSVAQLNHFKVRWGELDVFMQRG